MAISLQIVELWGVDGFRPPPGLTDFKKLGLNRVNRYEAVHFQNFCMPEHHYWGHFLRFSLGRLCQAVLNRASTFTSPQKRGNYLISSNFSHEPLSMLLKFIGQSD